METRTTETSTGTKPEALTWMVDYLAYPESEEGFEEACEALEKGAEEVMSTYNSRVQKQGATQTGKTAVKEAHQACLAAGISNETCQNAINEESAEVEVTPRNPDDGIDPEADVTKLLTTLVEAVKGHQESAAKYIGGGTRTQTGKAGRVRAIERIVEEEGDEAFFEMLVERWGEEKARALMAK